MTMNNAEVAKVFEFEMLSSNKTMPHRLWFQALREYLTLHPDHTLDAYMRKHYPNANEEIDELMSEIEYDLFFQERPDLAAQMIEIQGQKCITLGIIKEHAKWRVKHGLMSEIRANVLMSCETDEEMIEY